MTQATDQDIRELKIAIDTNSRAIDALAEANTKAIADLTALKEEMRVGFSNVETRFADVRGDIKLLDNRLGNLESTVQKLPDLTEKVGELKNWKCAIRCVLNHG
jgi:predicted  nucleic acid-binding Zn-ribbon protein